jgi:hypothetical protein
MESTTILPRYDYIYGLDIHSPQNTIDLNNKLFCTFTSLENLDRLVEGFTISIYNHVQQDVCTTYKKQ